MPGMGGMLGGMMGMNMGVGPGRDNSRRSNTAPHPDDVFQAPEHEGDPESWGFGADEGEAKKNGLIPGAMRPALTAMGNESARLQGAHEQRRGQTMDHLRDSQFRANQPTLDQRLISDLFGQNIAAAGGDALRQQRAMRAQGGAQGSWSLHAPYAQIEEARMGVLGKAQTDIAGMVAQDRSRMQQNVMNFDMAIGEVMNQAPSQYIANYLDKYVEMVGGLQISKDQLAAAQGASKAAKSAGKMGMIGSVIGGVLGMI